MLDPISSRAYCTLCRLLLRPDAPSLLRRDVFYRQRLTFVVMSCPVCLPCHLALDAGRVGDFRPLTLAWRTVIRCVATDVITINYAPAEDHHHG